MKPQYKKVSDKAVVESSICMCWHDKILHEDKKRVVSNIGVGKGMAYDLVKHGVTDCVKFIETANATRMLGTYEDRDA